MVNWITCYDAEKGKEKDDRVEAVMDFVSVEIRRGKVVPSIPSLLPLRDCHLQLPVPTRAIHGSCLKFTSLLSTGVP